MRGRLAVLGLVAFAAPAGADPPRPRAAVTVVVAGEPALVTRVRSAVTTGAPLPVDLRWGRLPNVPPARGRQDDIGARVAAARSSWVGADFPGCLAQLPPDVFGLLEEGRRAEAARALFWRVACQVGAEAVPEASAAARELATLGLDAPPEVDAENPEIEMLLQRARREVAASPVAPLLLSADVAAASVSIDGRPRACVTPCRVDLAPGDHVVRIDADGIVAATRRVRAGADREVAFRTIPAPPALASRQWTERYAGTTAIDSTPSVRLLSLATRARRIVLLTAERWARSVHLRAVLAVDGRVAARAEREGGARGGTSDDLGEEPSDLLREVLVRGRVVEPAPPLVARPLFWVIVGAVAAAAATVAGLVVYEPPTRTEVRY